MPEFHEVHSRLKRTVDATVEPLQYDAAMLHCRSDAQEEAPWFIAAISAARRYCETYTKRQFVNATWALYLDQFPNVIELRMPPVSAITSIVYNDAAGASQTLPSNQYRTDIISEPARIVPAYGYSWPSTRGQINDICVTFTAGYGAAASSVPNEVKQAMLLLISHWREHPEAVANNSVNVVPFAVDALLDSVCWSKVH